VTCSLRLSFAFVLLLAGSVGPSRADPDNGLIPFSQLATDDRQAVEAVVRAPTLSREIKGLTFRSRKEVYEYLLDHPDFAAAVARALNLSRYEIVKDGKLAGASDKAYWGTDGRGATGHFRVVYADKTKRVFFLQGTYEKKWLPTIPARAVVILVFEHKADREGTYVEQDLYGYLKIDQAFVALLTELLQPVMRGATDGKMKRTLGLGARISEMAYWDPAGMLKKLETSPELPPREFARFRQILCPSC